MNVGVQLGGGNQERGAVRPGRCLRVERCHSEGDGAGPVQAPGHLWSPPLAHPVTGEPVHIIPYTGHSCNCSFLILVV